ncbi:helix-turn-helix transcriptional regulator [Compostimonas suwonensis]|uniref:Helix-turn-helix protein n=1 Tax=Compostimonas suwonensis TaxID=1048394 RepID=A0A2M9BW37_9MICO|nr:hypothetical protein [Compostimonas suwonensis]PJJ62172.1 hypothetical protein CLV54_1969 [Compostimonas suwonensis]
MSVTHPDVSPEQRAVYLTPDQVCDLVPGMTKSNLSQLRFKGRGPKFLKPTARTVVYRERDVIEWLEASERISTASVQ